MKLFDEEIKRELSIPNLYETEEKSAEDVQVKIKFFDILSGWTWYATEAQRIDGDYTFFGLVVGFEAELGYFYLSELEEINKKFPRIERDLYFKPTTLAELQAECRDRR